MPRRARIALIGAAAGVGLLAVTWYLAHYVGPFMRADVSILGGFADLQRPRVDQLTTRIASLCDPSRYLFLAAIPIAAALLRRRPRVAVMLAVVLLGANETTELLKPLLTAPRDVVPWAPLGDSTWPSGHATAAMSLALCAVIAAPARRRPAVAAAMAAFAIAVCYSFLELGWHYPSDVFGGFLVAATWTLLGIAGLSIYEERLVRARPVTPGARQRGSGVPVAAALQPAAVLLAGAALLAALVLAARPHAVLAFAHSHAAFIVGASSIGALGLLLSAGLAVILRRG